jgi:hypothetical protein
MSFPKLLEAALAGTLRQAPPGAIGDHEAMSTETRLLRGASYEGLRRLAGRPLERIDRLVPLEPASPEVLTEIPPPAAVRLLELLDGRTDLLPEWLRFVAARHLRVPPLSVPDLLEYARAETDSESDSDLRELIREVGGERLAWLAGLNPDWHFAAYVDPEQQVALGAREERVSALRRIRRRHPARGRELLLDLWPSERPDARPKLLESLAIGLSAADEQFLEQTVGDPRREVRETALRLIRRIPNSRFGQRWAKRTRQVITLKMAVPEGARFDIGESIDVDPAWSVDGLDVRRPRDMGTTASVLRQLMALTPPSIWPPEALGAIDHTDWTRPLLAGLAQAARAYAHADWCERLLMLCAAATERREHVPFDPADLYGALEPQRAERVLQRVMELSPPLFGRVACTRADAWSPDFSHFVVEQLPRFLATHPNAIAVFLDDAALRLDPRVLPDAERLFDLEIEPIWVRSLLHGLAQTLDYRLTMRKELDG